MKKFESTRYQIDLYTDETKTAFKSTIYLSCNTDNIKSEIEYLKKNKPDIINCIKLKKIHTSFDSIDIDKFLEVPGGRVMANLEYKIFIHDLEADTYQVYDDRVYDSVYEANERKHNYLNRIDTNNYELCVRVIPKETVYKVISEAIFPYNHKSVIYRTTNYKIAKSMLDSIHKALKEPGLIHMIAPKCNYYIEEEECYNDREYK